MFSVHSTPEVFTLFKNTTIAGHFGFVFSNSSGWKNVFEKLRFGDELLWAVDLTVEIKLRFQISPV